MHNHIVVVLILFLNVALAQNPNWNESTPYPPDGLSNPYEINKSEMYQTIRSGRIHSLQYPVEISGLLIPYEPLKKFVDADSKNLFRKFIEKLFNTFTRIKSFDHLMDWLGLHEYPEEEGEGPYFIPFPDGQKPSYRMGESIVPTKWGNGFTVSCAECHSANLFGKKIIGLQNRFPRANTFFYYGIKGLKVSNSYYFKMATGANEDQRKMFKRAKFNSQFIKAKIPTVVGLDTSLAHVALSLSKRAQDEYATKDIDVAQNPRDEFLQNFTSDSKPGTWWNVKYKNRWLLDGSVVAGNPIYTNILWNEIGRGTDLRQLENWLDNNSEKIKELTTAVFSSEAPHITDFFDPGLIDVESARRGEKLFNQSCAKCHGHYEKDWGTLKNTRVLYHEQTPVKDVGTDPQRYLAMESLLQLNNLAISKKNGILIKKQKGYVPPPLVGVWARWPYFHNNSVPTLCAVLTPAESRPKSYYAGEALNPETDFDFDCNGYPTKNVPKEWIKNKKAFFDTTRPGLSNRGHDDRILVKDGIEIFSAQDKSDIIRYLQTL